MTADAKTHSVGPVHASVVTDSLTMSRPDLAGQVMITFFYENVGESCLIGRIVSDSQ